MTASRLIVSATSDRLGRLRDVSGEAPADCRQSGGPFPTLAALLQTCLGACETARRPCLRIDVTDTGVGIPQDKQAEIFDAFTQLETQNKRCHQGLGLGLSICKRLLALMEGEIGVDSSPGKGSRFWLRLPLRAPEGPCRPANDSRKTVGRPLWTQSSMVGG